MVYVYGVWFDVFAFSVLMCSGVRV